MRLRVDYRGLTLRYHDFNYKQALASLIKRGSSKILLM